MQFKESHIPTNHLEMPRSPLIFVPAYGCRDKKRGLRIKNESYTMHKAIKKNNQKPILEADAYASLQD
jgi:hypothetical protein